MTTAIGNALARNLIKRKGQNVVTNFVPFPLSKVLLEALGVSLSTEKGQKRGQKGCLMMMMAR